MPSKRPRKKPNMQQSKSKKFRAKFIGESKTRRKERSEGLESSRKELRTSRSRSTFLEPNEQPKRQKEPKEERTRPKPKKG